MEKILQRLYAGELDFAEREIKGNERYDALCARTLLDMEAFTKKLDEDMKREFEAIMESQLELSDIERSQSFSDGFSLGAGIMAEVFETNSHLLSI